jgi:hypothetical protein
MCSEGTPIRYGQPEPWKVIIQQIGRSKPSRAPNPEKRHRKKNDGRPPDTSRELLGPTTNKKKTNSSPSYPWSNNSCFLDTSLELVFQTVLQDFPGFSTRFKLQESESTLTLLHRMMELRKLIVTEGSEKNPSAWLAIQRDSFREHLRSQKIIKSLSSYEGLFVIQFFIIINSTIY